MRPVAIPKRGNVSTMTGPEGQAQLSLAAIRFLPNV